MRTTAGDEPAFSCKPSGALKNKAASAVMRQAAKPGVPGKENLERAAGIEPAWKAWKASALPLSYARAGN